MRFSKQMLKDVTVSIIITGIVGYFGAQLWVPVGFFLGTVGVIATVGIASAHSIGMDPRHLYRAYKMYSALSYDNDEKVGVGNMVNMATSPGDVFDEIEDNENGGRN